MPSVLVVCYDTSTGRYLVQKAGSAQISDGAITSAHIASGIIGTVHLRDLNVTSAKLTAALIASIEADVADEAITSAKLASGAVIGDRVAVDGIVSSHIGANVIGGIHILAGAIVSGKIGVNVIGNTHLYSGKVQHARLGGVTADQHHIQFTSGMHSFAHPSALIANQAVTSAKLASGQVGIPHIYPGAVTSAKINAEAIGNTHLRSGDVQHIRLGGIGAGDHHAEFTSGMHNFAHPSALIGTGAITSAKIASGQVGIPHIYPGAVTSAKIGALAVGTPHLRDLNVTSAKLAAAVIASIEAPLADESVTSAKLASGAIIGDRIAVNGIVSSHIGANVIGGIHILPGAIVSGKIGANVIATPHILNQGILSASIGALAVGPPHIAANAIVSGKVASGGLSPLSSGKIWAGFTGNFPREENKGASVPHGADQHTNVNRWLYISAQGNITDGVGTLVGYTPVIELADAATEYVMFNFRVPDKFVSFIDVYIVWSTPQTIPCNMRARWYAHYYADGQAYNTHSDTPNFNGGSNHAHAGANVFVVTRSTAHLHLVNLTKNDYLGIKFERNGSNPNDSVSDVVHVAGLLFYYVAEQ